MIAAKPGDEPTTPTIPEETTPGGKRQAEQDSQHTPSKKQKQKQQQQQAKYVDVVIVI